MGYAIAAYVVVVGTLLVYGLRVHQQRRALIRRAEAAAAVPHSAAPAAMTSPPLPPRSPSS